jgi:hypothetical protein
MLDHEITKPLGTLILIDIPWWGVGAMLGGAASWLLKTPKPLYVHCSNYFYADRSKSPNQFDWLFEEQQPINNFQVVHNRLDEALPINSHLTPSIISFQKAAAQVWTPLAEHLATATIKLPNPLNTLALHYRGTDKWLELTPTPLPAFFDQIDKAMETNQYRDILLCTDDDNIMQKTKERYPQLLYFEDHLRASGKVGLHQTKGSYRQAVETFTEILAMGMCKHLICGRSCVSDCAIIFARNQTFTWEYHN